MIRFGGRPFQLHLFTCIVLMFVASGFLRLNTIPEYVGFGESRVWAVYGWPSRAQTIKYHGSDMASIIDAKWELRGLLCDVALALGALLGVAWLIEGTAWYREQNAPADTKRLRPARRLHSAGTQILTTDRLRRRL